MKNSKLFFRILICLFGMGLLLESMPASAELIRLSPSIFSEEISVPLITKKGDTTTPESISLIVNDDWHSIDGASKTTGGSFLSVHSRFAMSIGITPWNPYSGGAATDLSYYWAITQTGGAPYSGTVPVIIHTAGYVDYYGLSDGGGVGNLFADATFYLIGSTHGYTPSDTKAMPAIDSGYFVPGKYSFNKTFTADIVLDRENRIDLRAYGSGAVWKANGSFAFEAYVDPTIIIDPAFDRKDDFRIIFSNGVSAVPLPSSLTLMLPGILWLAGVFRFKHR